MAAGFLAAARTTAAEERTAGATMTASSWMPAVLSTAEAFLVAPGLGALALLAACVALPHQHQFSPKLGAPPWAALSHGRPRSAPCMQQRHFAAPNGFAFGPWGGAAWVGPLPYRTRKCRLACARLPSRGAGRRRQGPSSALPVARPWATVVSTGALGAPARALAVAQARSPRQPGGRGLGEVCPCALFVTSRRPRGHMMASCPPVASGAALPGASPASPHLSVFSRGLCFPRCWRTPPLGGLVLGVGDSFVFLVKL